MNRPLIAIAAAAVLASCSSGAGITEIASPAEVETTTTDVQASTTIETATTVPATTTTTTATTTVPAPTTTIDPIVHAADYFVEHVTPSNCALQIGQFTEGAFAGPDGSIRESEFNDYHEVLTPAWEGIRDGLENLADALIAYKWPDDLQQDVDALVLSTVTNAVETQSRLDADAYSSFFALPAYTANPHATIVRAKLDLDSNLNNDTEWCAQ